MHLLKPIEESPYYGQWIKNEVERELAQTFVEKPLRHYEREDFNDIIALMKTWKTYIGISVADISVEEIKKALEAELVILVQFLYDNFPHITYTDLKLARNWAVSGKTDLTKVSKKTLSAEYVSRSIVLYEERKREILSEMNRNKAAFIRAEEEKKAKQPKTPAEKANLLKSFVMGYYDSHQKGLNFVDMRDHVYNWIKNSKVFAVSAEMIAEAGVYANTRFNNEKSELNKVNALAGHPIIKDTPEDEENRKNKYKKHFIIMKFFEKHSIDDIVKMIHPDQFN